MSKKDIATVKFLKGPFGQRRSAYSSGSLFVAILIPANSTYDPECIGEKLLPRGFGYIDPPGPIDGLGALGTSPDGDGCYPVIALRDPSSAAALDEHMDGYFIIDIADTCMHEVTKRSFHDSIISDAFKMVRVIEFEPD